METERNEAHKENNILRVTLFEAEGDNGRFRITMSALAPAYIGSIALILEGFNEGKLDKAAFGAVALVSTYVASRRVDSVHKKLVELEKGVKNNFNNPLQ